MLLFTALSHELLPGIEDTPWKRVSGIEKIWKDGNGHHVVFDRGSYLNCCLRPTETASEDKSLCTVKYSNGSTKNFNNKEGQRIFALVFRLLERDLACRENLLKREKGLELLDTLETQRRLLAAKYKKNCLGPMHDADRELAQCETKTPYALEKLAILRSQKKPLEIEYESYKRKIEELEGQICMLENKHVDLVRHGYTINLNVDGILKRIIRKLKEHREQSGIIFCKCDYLLECNLKSGVSARVRELISLVHKEK